MDLRQKLLISYRNGCDLRDGYSQKWRRAMARQVRKTVKRAVAAEIEHEMSLYGPHAPRQRFPGSKPGDWVAYYAPMLAKGQSDPSRGGFPSEHAAWDFVFDGMCGTCRAERAMALSLSEAEREESSCSLHPPCACEWFVIREIDYEHAESFDDVIAASGWVQIYPSARQGIRP